MRKQLMRNYNNLINSPTSNMLYIKKTKVANTNQVFRPSAPYGARWADERWKKKDEKTKGWNIYNKGVSSVSGTLEGGSVTFFRTIKPKHTKFPQAFYNVSTYFVGVKVRSAYYKRDEARAARDVWTFWWGTYIKGLDGSSIVFGGGWVLMLKLPPSSSSFGSRPSGLHHHLRGAFCVSGYIHIQEVGGGTHLLYLYIYIYTGGSY